MMPGMAVRCTYQAFGNFQSVRFYLSIQILYVTGESYPMYWRSLSDYGYKLEQ